MLSQSKKKGEKNEEEQGNQWRLVLARLKTPQHRRRVRKQKKKVSATFCSALYVLQHEKNREGEQIFFHRYRSRLQTGSFRGHLVEGS